MNAKELLQELIKETKEHDKYFPLEILLPKLRKILREVRKT